jgi:hypothetical protein
MRHILSLLMFAIGVAWLGVIVFGNFDASATAKLFNMVSTLFGWRP